MPKLAEVLPKDLLQALLKAGFFISNQSGSHVRLHHADGQKATLAIHPKPLARVRLKQKIFPMRFRISRMT